MFGQGVFGPRHGHMLLACDVAHDMQHFASVGFLGDPSRLAMFGAGSVLPVPDMPLLRRWRAREKVPLAVLAYPHLARSTR